MQVNKLHNNKMIYLSYLRIMTIKRVIKRILNNNRTKTIKLIIKLNKLIMINNLLKKKMKIKNFKKKKKETIILLYLKYY